MLDPATIGLAIAGVTKAAELVKSGIAAARDVNDVTKDLGKLFDHTETLSKAKKEVGKGKNKSLNEQAMNIVTAERNARQALADIKQKLLWGPYADGGQIWKDFLKTRQSMIREQKLAQEREIALKKKRIDAILHWATVIGILGFGGFMIWLMIAWGIDMGKKAGKW